MDRALFAWIFPLHLTGMGLNLIALVLTVRDLYKREFESANDKVTRMLLIVSTGGIGWLVYVFRHALKPPKPADGTQGAPGHGPGQ